MSKLLVVSYYNAAKLYGLQSVETAAKKWLEINLLLVKDDYCFLKGLTLEIMTVMLLRVEIYLFIRRNMIFTTCSEFGIKENIYLKLFKPIKLEIKFILRYNVNIFTGCLSK